MVSIAENKVSASGKLNLKILPHVLRIAYFTYFFSVGCVQTFYSVILKKIGLTNSHIGTLHAIGLIGGIISPISVGYFADRYKKTRLTLIFISTLCVLSHGLPIIVVSFTKLNKISHDISLSNSSTVASTLPPLQDSGTDNDVLIFAGLVFAQFFATFCDQGSKALMDGMMYKVINTAKDHGLELDFARLRMFGGLGICIASILSGLSLDYIKSWISFGFPEELILVALCFIMGAVYVVNLILYIPDAEASGSVSLTHGFSSIISNVDVVMLLLLQFVVQFATNVTKNFDSLYVIHMGGTKLLSGIALSVNYVADVLMMYFSPIITEALGRNEYTVVLSLFIAGIRVFLYAFADSPYLSLSNAFLQGFCVGLNWPSVSKLMKGYAPPALIGTYISTLTTVGKIGAAISTKTGGNISDILGYKAIYIISAFCFTGIGVLYLIYTMISLTNFGRKSRNKNKSKSEQSKAGHETDKLEDEDNKI